MVAPGDPSGNSIGLLAIDGDFAQSAPGSLQIELAGTGTPGVHYDHLSASRFGFLGGTLEVALVDAFMPQVGDSFEILTVDEEFSGTFEDLILPGIFQWDVMYDPVIDPQRILLKVIGLGLIGDFNSSGQYDPQDIDMIFSQIPGSVPPADASFDLVGDGTLNQADVDQLVLNLMNRQFGDADLDQDIDITDFNSLSAHFDPSGNSLTWTHGNFDGDGDVDITDFNVLSLNFSPNGYTLSAIPEPTGFLLLIAGAAAVVARGRRVKSGRSGPTDDIPDRH